MNRLAIPTLSILLVSFCACNRPGKIKVKNSFTRMTIENVYWGDVYIGGALKAGEETDYSKVKSGDETLPTSNQIIFSVVSNEIRHFYTSESYALDHGQEIFIELSDTITYYEIDY